ncbi:DUF6318 family protein [Arthrobacter sp. ISL-48]|uniref:DUF6318 family protein n=1 Tax=Arthrobacter sp. ISL-48 TaxID=2819110 RepID=UPI0037BE93F9
MTSQNFYTSQRPRTVTVTLAVAAALALSGCNSGSEPTQNVSSSSSASESGTPSPTSTPTPTAAYRPASASGPAENVPVPVLPEVAKTETKEGLEAFTRYWFELLSYGYETGDVTQVSAITSPSCAMCEQAREVQMGWHQDGRWLGGGKVTTPTVSTTFRVAADGNYQVAVQVSQEPLSYYNADGTIDSTEPRPANSGSLMLAVYKDGAWFVNTIEPIAG